MYTLRLRVLRPLYPRSVHHSSATSAATSDHHQVPLRPTQVLLSMPPNVLDPDPRTIVPRDNSINTTPLVIIPMLCVAIFALIGYYTFKDKRETPINTSGGRLPPRSVSSRESTSAWVRGLRSGARGRNKKTGRARTRETTIGTSGTRNYQASSDANGRSVAGLDSDGSQLSTIKEEIEAETGNHHLGGRNGRRSPEKSPLKGGKRASSTIRPV